MLIENIKILESFCDSVVDKNDTDKVQKNNIFNDNESESFFENVSECKSLDLISLNELSPNKNSIFDKLIHEYIDKEKFTMAELVKSNQIFIENHDLESNDKEVYKKRFLDFNYPIV